MVNIEQTVGLDLFAGAEEMVKSTAVLGEDMGSVPQDLELSSVTKQPLGSSDHTNHQRQNPPYINSIQRKWLFNIFILFN